MTMYQIHDPEMNPTSDIPTTENQPLLLVDDSENDVELMRMAFHRANFNSPLYALRNGEEAIAYLTGEGIYSDRDMFPHPAVMLLDLNMPMKNGFEVLAWLRAQPEYKRLLVIVLTASMRSDDVERAFGLKADAFFVKPSDLDELTAMLRCLRDWLHYNHFPPLK